MKVLTRYSTLSKLDVPLHLGNRKEELRENPAMKLCHQYMPSYKTITIFIPIYCHTVFKFLCK